MKCCQLLVDQPKGESPFRRTISVGYYDGPTFGFTECLQCGQAWSFRELDWSDWDDLRQVRIFAFAPLDVALESVIARLGVKFAEGQSFLLLPPQDEQNGKLIEALFPEHPTRMAAILDWPGQLVAWCAIGSLERESVRDWFSFLSVPRTIESPSA